MNKEIIAKALKEYRKKNALSVKDVVYKLENKSINVAEKTVYGWENGQSQPNIDTIFALCEIYHIKDILGTFGYTKPKKNFFLTDFEKELILSLRQHPEMLNAIKKLLDLK